MKIIIFGLGRQGERILDFLIENNFNNITLYDFNINKLKYLKGKYSTKVNILEGIGQDLRKVVSDYDIIVDSLPSYASKDLFVAVSELGKKMVSISYTDFDFMQFNEIAKKKKAIIIPDCGAAPGFSHLLAGYSSKKIKNPVSVKMVVGAIPKMPKPPFMHNITWSVHDLLEEYIRRAKIKIDGEISEIEPFSNIENERLFDLDLESFYTDGVRSFVQSFPDIPNVEEKTLRYKGHLDFMKAFKDAGLLSYKEYEFNKIELKGIDIFEKVIKENFLDLPKEDIFLMKIEVKGKRETHIHKYYLEYDKQSALVNSVSITAFKAIELLSTNKLQDFGILPLEKIVDESLYDFFVKAHKSVGTVYLMEKLNVN